MLTAKAPSARGVVGKLPCDGFDAATSLVLVCGGGDDGHNGTGGALDEVEAYVWLGNDLDPAACDAAKTHARVAWGGATRDHVVVVRQHMEPALFVERFKDWGGSVDAMGKASERASAREIRPLTRLAASERASEREIRPERARRARPRGASVSESATARRKRL